MKQLKFYSEVEKDLLLHIVIRKKDILEKGREDVIEPTNFLQCSVLNMDRGKTFKPHHHIWKDSSKVNMMIAQESWVVVKGKVMCDFYDIDNKILTSCVLEEGDASFTLQGGHNYTIMI